MEIFNTLNNFLLKMVNSVDYEFIRRLMEDDDDEYFDEEEYDCNRIRPSDLDLPLLDGKTCSKLFEVPLGIGEIVSEILAFSYSRSLEEGDNEWYAMFYDGDMNSMTKYFKKNGEINGSICVSETIGAFMIPQAGGLHIGLSKDMLKKLAEYFPSDEYKKNGTN